MTWMGNHDARTTPARFVGRDESALLVQPSNGFVGDAGGGYGVPTVTGQRHDQVAREAPAWFRASIEALCAAGGGVTVAARCVGSAGKYRFWTAPAGVVTPAQWEAVTAEMVADQAARKAAEKSAMMAADLVRERRDHAARAEYRGLLIVDEQIRNAGEYSQCLLSIALADDGREYHIVGHEVREVAS